MCQQGAKPQPPTFSPLYFHVRQGAEPHALTFCSYSYLPPPPQEVLSSRHNLAEPCLDGFDATARALVPAALVDPPSKSIYVRFSDEEPAEAFLQLDYSGCEQPPELHLCVTPVGEVNSRVVLFVTVCLWEGLSWCVCVGGGGGGGKRGWRGGKGGGVS